MFHFSAKSSTFLTSSLVPIVMSIESNHSKWWIDRPGQRCQSPAEVYGRKIESNAYAFWSSLEILRSNSKLSRLVQESERLDINLSKNWLEFQIMLKSTVTIEEYSRKNRRKLLQQSQRNHMVWWVKTIKILTRTFSKFEIFFSFCIIILVEYFVHFMLHKCYWILVNYLFNLIKFGSRIYMLLLRLSEDKFDFALTCA